MMPDPIFLNIHMYGIMIAIGVLCAFATLSVVAKKKSIDGKFTDFVFYNGLVSIAVGFGSAALFQAVYDYIENPSAGFHFNGGLTFIGGLIGGVICFLLIYAFYRRKYTARLYQIISILPCSILIAHAFGRVGCFFAGCCYGKETDSFLGVQFPDLPNPVHPTQLYEAAFLFLMFAICLYFVIKMDFKHNLSVYLMAYGIFRFFLEYLRDDHRGALVGSISPSQFWSVLMVVAGVVVIFTVRRIYRKAAKDETVS